MLTLLFGTDWKQNKDAVLTRIAGDVSRQLGGRILMVPELVSHQTERDLAEYAGDSASRFAEVLSFTRLARRVADWTGHGTVECLDNGGRVVAMASAARQLHSKLKAYAAVETRPEFLTGLLDAVDEFKRCCITAGDLMQVSRQTEGSLSQKLEELSLILETYNSICARGKKDPRDQMTWLLEQLEDSDFAKKHVFYFDGFPDFSRQHMDILQHLILHSDHVVISLNCDKPASHAMAFEKAGDTASDLISFAKRNDIPLEIVYLSSSQSPLRTVTDSLLQGNMEAGVAAGCLQVCHAETAYAECTAVAERIIELVENGCRYRDISVVCSDLQTYKGPVSTIFSRAHIPIYLSGTEDILERTVIHTVLSALDAALGGFSQKDVLRYLKSMLSPIRLDLCDRIENYAILWSIDGKQWLKEWGNHPRGLEDQWTDHDRDRLKQLNEGREKALAPLQRLYEGFQHSVCIAQQVQVLYDFLTDIHFAVRLQQIAEQMDRNGDNRNAQILNQLWEILLAALEQLHDVLGETSWDADTFTRLLKLLLSQYDVGTIPSVLDAVTVGAVSSMRCHRCKHLFVLGASEGLLPSYGTSAGILNDQERSVLQKLGIPLNAGAIDGLQTQFSEIQEVFCGTEETVTVFCSEGQPSFIYERLKYMAGAEMAVKPSFGAALTDKWEAAAYLASANGEQEAAKLMLDTEFQTVMASKNHTLGQIGEDTVRSLYGSELRLSASQIDRLSECRMSYFLKYGLRAKERKAAQIDPAEFGTYVHAVLEECGKKIVAMGGFKQVSLEDTLSIAADISARYFAERFSKIGTERMSYHFRKNTQEVNMIVQELWEEMQESLFQPYDFELGFGDGEKMPAVPISGKTMQAHLGGFVDRVDLWQEHGQNYIRVVDYKTGKKDFDYCDVFNGIGLQMLLYLFALEDGSDDLFGATPQITGVQYFPARVPLVASDGVLTEEQAADARSKNFRRKGLLLSDEEILRAMEPSDNPKRLCCSRKKDGSISGDIASREQFRQLKRYVYGLLSGIVDEIASGNVTPNPYTRGSSHNACTFCPYGEICHSADVDRRNYQAMTAERFWTEIERKEQGNG